MLNYTTQISRNYFFELIFFHTIRNFMDGITLFELILNADFYKADHNPKLIFRLIIVNITVFEIAIYNINHKRDSK